MAVQAHATAKYVRTSAQKAGLVLDLIRGRDVNAALATLRFARKGVARDIEKVLRSAIANASAEGRLRRRRRATVHHRVLREPGPVAEADPPGPDGPGVPGGEAHRAPDGAGRRAARAHQRAGRGWCARRAEAAARRQAQGAAESDGQGVAEAGREGGRRAEETAAAGRAKKKTAKS